MEPARGTRELNCDESDLRDLALVRARMATDNGNRTSLDDVLAVFGHTKESLAEVDDEGADSAGLD